LVEATEAIEVVCMVIFVWKGNYWHYFLGSQIDFEPKTLLEFIFFSETIPLETHFIILFSWNFPFLLEIEFQFNRNWFIISTGCRTAIIDFLFVCLCVCVCVRVYELSFICQEKIAINFTYCHAKWYFLYLCPPLDGCVPK